VRSFTIAYTQSVRVAIVPVLALLLIGCAEEPEPAPLPPMGSPAAAMTWPSTPDGLDADVRQCVDDYRRLAREGLPSLAEGQAFDAWYAADFSRWSEGYNDVRARCDAVFEAQPSGSAAAQLMLATQSYLHERLAEEAAPHEEHAQMFVMSRYWSLGAACTYQSCQQGPDRRWAALCERRAGSLPECPPIEPTTE